MDDGRLLELPEEVEEEDGRLLLLPDVDGRVVELLFDGRLLLVPDDGRLLELPEEEGRVVEELLEGRLLLPGLAVVPEDEGRVPGLAVVIPKSVRRLF